MVPNDLKQMVLEAIAARNLPDSELLDFVLPIIVPRKGAQIEMLDMSNRLRCIDSALDALEIFQKSDGTFYLTDPRIALSLSVKIYGQLQLLLLEQQAAATETKQ
jgi:hypothetical protein